jgi:two-component system, OmpR family, sensor kinase
MTPDALFLGRVSHDLRGELATMVAGVHYLLRYEPGLGEGARRMLERVNGAGQRLRRLVDELENAAWIEGGDPAALALEPCAAGALLGVALRRLGVSVVALGVTLMVDVPAEGPSFDGDPELLATALGYALEFAVLRSKGKIVRVRGEVDEGAPVIAVSDEGGDLEAVTLGGLLQPFAEKEAVSKTDPTTRRELLGLGLSIAAGILRAHGGGMRASPAAGGQGVTLRCALSRPPAPMRRTA